MDKSNEESRKVYFEYYRVKRSVEFMGQYDGWKSWQGLQGRIKERRSRRMVWGVSVAAAVSVLLVSVTYLLSVRDSENRDVPKIATETSFPEKGSKKAMLTLANGELVDLSLQNGRVRNKREEIVIDNSDQQLVYQSVKSHTKDLTYNTLSVPRGGEYQLVLSDGTKVWINAESSLRYPEVFGDKREVTLDGEAYFEVARDAERSFVVHVKGNSVEVLGTHFNISAYADQPVTTTLAEGKVKVSALIGSVVLAPDQQAIIASGMAKIEVKKVDAVMFTSWIKGSYTFKNTELKDIAALLSRWYDVDIRFMNEELKHKRFAGIIYRDEELGFAIDVIARVADVDFVRDGNVIYVDNPK